MNIPDYHPKVRSRFKNENGFILEGTFFLSGSMDKPEVIYEMQRIDGATLLATLSLNPEWLVKVDNPKYQYHYSGLIVFPQKRLN